ncbi:type 1 fimbrial protein [Pseudomonas sp. NFXW11]|uniref:fimbrial protein n=1 Tax=Pseudomonas sp. NFXW11 TaxID=2819531 RepID=UPI003CE6F13F
MPALADSVLAKGCRFLNVGVGNPWVEVTPLTSSTPVGAVLKQRSINPYINYSTERSIGGAAYHELVSAAHWPPGTRQDGIIPTNIAGIGFKVTHPAAGEDIVLTTSAYPVALEKLDVKSSPNVANMVTHYLYSLVLTRPVNELPSGSLEITHLNDYELQLYALNLPRGTARIGQELRNLPGHSNDQACNQRLVVKQASLIGTPPVFSKTCEVVTRNVKRQLGSFAPADFPALNATSPPSELIRLDLGNCTVNARPQVSFTDMYPAADTCKSAGILELAPSSRGRAVARGVGIAMFNDQGRIHCGKQYSVARTPGSDSAHFDFRAQYIRTGEIREGDADGGVQFQFTFP